MGIFNRKPKTEVAQKELPPKIGKVAGIARGLAMKTVTRSVQNVYNQNRIIFKGMDNVDFIEKDGRTNHYSLDELASHLWSQMDEQATQQTGQPAFAALDIKPSDVKNEIMKLPRYKEISI